MENMKSPIEQEIEWCEAHMGESENGIEFENGFIAGLKQVLRLGVSLENSLRMDGCSECGHLVSHFDNCSKVKLKEFSDEMSQSIYHSTFDDVRQYNARLE